MKIYVARTFDAHFCILCEKSMQLGNVARRETQIFVAFHSIQNTNFN